MQQRYYDPESGRFLSADPVQVGGNGESFNRYAYANDNPYRYTDPDGRIVWTGDLYGGQQELCGQNRLACDMAFATEGKAKTSKHRAPIYGTPQNSRNTPTHASTSQRIAEEAAGSPGTDRAHLNQRLTTVTGNPTAPKIQPDVTVVNRSGTIDMYEVRSAGQSNAELISKLAAARAGLGVSGKNIVMEPDPIPMGRGMLLRGMGPFGILEMILHQAAIQHEAARTAAQQQTTCVPPGCI
jgi:uncharacterized protein RhaS with RHS repeats